MEHALNLDRVSDDELLRRVAEILRQSRHTEADLVAHIGEVDARRLYAREACPSMFQYCTERLHLSEAEAYLRIAAARASREHPALLTMLADGRLHLSAIAKLAPHLNSGNHEALLARAAHRTKREVEELLAEIAPRPDAPERVRKLPAPGIRSAPASPRPADRASASTVELRLDGAIGSGAEQRGDGVDAAHPAVSSERLTSPAVDLGLDGVGPRRVAPPATVQPLAPGRYRVQFTASASLRDKLERLQALMHSSTSGGDLAAVIEDAVTEKLERLEARRFGRTKAPRKALEATGTKPSSRHIPAAVRRAVHERDGGRCRFVDEQGRRCGARHALEYHHRHPLALGGEHAPDAVALLCRGHNQYIAEVDYGRLAMARHRRSCARPRTPRGTS